MSAHKKAPKKKPDEVTPAILRSSYYSGCGLILFPTLPGSKPSECKAITLGEGLVDVDYDDTLSKSSADIAYDDTRRLAAMAEDAGLTPVRFVKYASQKMRDTRHAAFTKQRLERAKPAKKKLPVKKAPRQKAPVKKLPKSNKVPFDCNELAEKLYTFWHYSNNHNVSDVIPRLATELGIREEFDLVMQASSDFIVNRMEKTQVRVRALTPKKAAMVASQLTPDQARKRQFGNATSVTCETARPC